MALSALRVMVVEDHGFQRRMALRLLAELGIQQVSEAGGGAGALDTLRQLRREAPGNAPEVLLVDLDMPGMDGVEFIEHVARENLAPTVVLVSALDPALLNTVQAMTRAYGLRVIGCVEKPLTLAKLQDVLSRSDDVLHPLVEAAVPDVPVAALRQALAEGRVLPWFQLQVEIANGKPVGVEALARWERQDGGVILPRHFVPVLEREGLAGSLTESMLDQGCQWIRRWEAQGLCLQLSVNVSPATLADPDSADRYHAIVRGHGVDPAHIVLEITEGSVMTDAAVTLGVLARLRLKGFGLSVDDFGTGYSSLSQLSQVPFTELKIDQVFVGGASKHPRQRAMIEASLDLARKLGLEVVAEGVESVDDWRLLAELGCGIAQGHLVARPVPGEGLEEAIGQWRRPEC
ncbi:MAG TPA: EAL domain-containing response regulator [Xanthomonadaceae bacterium]|nr:EAL domain-containing response regulator [Xanthomonadaceae bacterium]